MFERNQSLNEQCYHPECTETRWLRYCPIEGRDSDGYVSTVVSQLEYILKNQRLFENGKVSYEVDDKDELYTLNLTQHNMPEDLVQVIGYTYYVAIQYEKVSDPSRQIYRVISEWVIPDEDIVSDGYRTEYCIELYPGRLHATITEYDITISDKQVDGASPTQARADRLMTPYDHQQLSALLSNIENLDLVKVE